MILRGATAPSAGRVVSVPLYERFRFLFNCFNSKRVNSFRKYQLSIDVKILMKIKFVRFINLICTGIFSAFLSHKIRLLGSM